MTRYERLFGAGARGAILSIVLLLMTYYVEDIVGLDLIFSNDLIRYSAFLILSLLGITVILWSVISLPPKERGNHLITKGAFKYFRHPLYASFLLFLNTGFAILLNNWIYILWALALFPIWSINVESEEELMKKEFKEKYELYCRNTWKFFPKL